MTSSAVWGGPRFTPLVEINESEGETWTWWIQVNGNQGILDEIKSRIEAAMNESDYYEEYDLPEWPYGETLGIDQVGLLERWSHEGYCRDHNVVAGVLIRSQRWIRDGESSDPYNGLDALYKGGIDDWQRVE
jgi:hypothetical protein